MELNALFTNTLPSYCNDLLQSPSLQRLKGVDMNCGMKYTDVDFFHSIHCFSRLEHSVQCAKVVNKYTNEANIIISALLHDIATPVFSHSIDFMKGDYLKQEATESEGIRIIQNDPVITNVIHHLGLTLEDIQDYHKYPIADNDSPKLSSDRLSYTLANSYNYHVLDVDLLRKIYADIVVGKNEYGEVELMFQSVDIASKFTEAMLVCSKIYVSDENRLGMEMIARLLRKMLHAQAITENDLYDTEEHFIQAHILNTIYEEEWNAICALHHTVIDSSGICIHAKKRYINAYVQNKGRILDINKKLQKDVETFLHASQDIQVKGERR